MMDLLKKVYESQAVRKAFWVLAGAVAAIVAQHFGFTIPGVTQ